MVVLVHLTFLETKKDPQARFHMKLQLTRRLYDRGWERDDVINLLKVVDWALVIPEKLELEYKEKLHKLEEEKNMSYVTSFERLSREEGLQQGLQQGREEGREEGLELGLEKGEHRRAVAIAKNMLAEGMSPQAVQKLTGLPENEVMDLVNKH